MGEIRLAFMSSEKDSLIDRKLIVLGGRFPGRRVPPSSREGRAPCLQSDGFIKPSEVNRPCFLFLISLLFLLDNALMKAVKHRFGMYLTMVLMNISLFS